jgi:hypothetical protein
VTDPPYGGQRSIFIDTLDQSGKRQPGVRVRLVSPDLRSTFGDIPTEAKAGEAYAAGFPMNELAPAYRVAPDDGSPADAVTGLGLGNLAYPQKAMLTSYGFTWQWTVAGQAAPTATPVASSAGPGDAQPLPAGPQRLRAGQRVWYAFHYEGDNSELRVQLSAFPPDRVTFGVWTPDNVRSWQLGDPEQPVGRGAPNAELGGDLLWVGTLEGNGTYYVVVDDSGPYPTTINLKVTGSGVSPAGTGQ